MVYTTEPYVLSLTDRGYVEGLTHISKDSKKALCRYFGGIPYALPPVGPYRFARPRPLPACYKYGTRVNPGKFTGGVAVCPQSGENEPPSEDLLNTWDENCLQSNVWIPVGEPPKAGWPVLFYIHGGWLQVGSANKENMTALLGETECQCIVVTPAYRLNIFGFLASRELKDEASSKGETFGNYGFWDQRLALEWAYKNISYFGGDASNITVTGYSAGSHSTFHQLSYDLYLPPAQRIIKRAVMHSNGSGMQPKSVQETQQQFDAFLTALSIPLSLPASEKLSRLRSTSTRQLIAASTSIPLHEFRAVSDGSFVRKSLFADIDSGDYAQRLRENGVQLIIGENRDEQYIYGSYRQPAADTRDALRTRMIADYPVAAVNALMPLYSPDGNLPTWRPCKNWREDAHGYIFADLQVYALERGFIDRLVGGGASENVFRYRIEWRAKCCDSVFPKEWGVTHGTDRAVWFWGNNWENGTDNTGLLEEEKESVKAFVSPFFKFLHGKMRSEDWGTNSHRDARRLTPDGKVDTAWHDEDYDRGVQVYDTIREAQSKGITARESKI